MERYNELKAEIIGLADNWQRLTDLSHFTINHTFVESFKDDDPDTCADTEAYAEYRSARIRWYLASCSRLNEVDLEDIVVHEIGHVLLAPIEAHVKKGKDEWGELAVQNLARALISTRNSTNSPWIPEFKPQEPLPKRIEEMSDFELKAYLTLNGLHASDIDDERDALLAEQEKRKNG